MLPEVLGVLVAVSLTITLCAVLLTDYWRVFPLWSAWLALTFWQSVGAAWADPQDVGWWLHIWAPAEKGVLALAILATAEAIWLRTRGLGRMQRFQARFGLAVAPFFLIFHFAKVKHDTAFAEFLQWREWVWVWLALTAFTCFLFCAFRISLVPRLARDHSEIWMALLMAHAIAAPQIHRGMWAWFGWQAAFRVATAALAILWVRNCARLSADTRGAPFVLSRARGPAATPVPAARSDLQPLAALPVVRPAVLRVHSDARG